MPVKQPRGTTIVTTKPARPDINPPASTSSPTGTAGGQPINQTVPGFESFLAGDKGKYVMIGLAAYVAWRYFR